MYSVVVFILFKAKTLISPFLFCALDSPTAVDDVAAWPVAGVPGVRWSPEGFAVLPVGFAVLPLGVLFFVGVTIFCQNSSLISSFRECVLLFSVEFIFIFLRFCYARRLRCSALRLCCMTNWSVRVRCFQSARRLRCIALRLRCGPYRATRV